MCRTYAHRTADPSFPTDPSAQRARRDHDGLTCDFCGGDVFVSFFECLPCALSLSSDTNGTAFITDIYKDMDAEAVIICPGCYVEGRTCVCTHMVPVQRLPMSALFEDQNAAVRILAPCALNYRETPVPMSFRTIRALEHPPVFESACIIWSRRRELKSNNCQSLFRMCSSRRKEHDGNKGTHPTPLLITFRCRLCHASKCLGHVLDCGIHSTDAFIMHAKDSTNDQPWHDFHKQRSQSFVEERKKVEEAEEAGEPCNMKISLVIAAQRYPACYVSAVAKVATGWYDNSFYLRTKLNLTARFAIMKTRQSGSLLSYQSPGPATTDMLESTVDYSTVTIWE